MDTLHIGDTHQNSSLTICLTPSLNRFAGGQQLVCLVDIAYDCLEETMWRQDSNNHDGELSMVYPG